MTRLVFNIAKAIPSYLQPQVKVRRDGHTQRYWVLPPDREPDVDEVGVFLADDKTLGLRFIYDPALISRIKALPNKQWDPTKKVWRVPLEDYPLVEKKLKHLALTEKALAALEAAGLVSDEPSEPASEPAPPKPERKGEPVPIFERDAETKATRKRGVMAQVRKEYRKLLRVATANDVTHVAVIRSPHHADLSHFRLGRGDAVLAEIEIRDGVAQAIRGSGALPQEAEKALTGVRSVVPVYGSPVMLMPKEGPTPKWARPTKPAPTKPVGPLVDLFEKLAPIQPVAKPASKPVERRVEPEPVKQPTYTLYGGSGYGDTGWKPGDVVENSRKRVEAGEPKWLYVLESKSRYIRDDGMSFGVGDDSGYTYSAVCREATAEEAAPLIAKEAARQAKAEAAKTLREAGESIRQAGEIPPGQHLPEGQTVNLGKGQDIYGGGEWLVIGKDYIWYVRNNGADGDDWSQNNVLTGGAGAIGWRVPYHRDLADSIRHAAGAPEPVEQPPVEPVDAQAEAEALRMIGKYHISLAPEKGPDMLRLGKKPPKEELEIVRAAKPVILKVLRAKREAFRRVRAHSH